MFSQAHGGSSKNAPPELIELSLMEQFHWTPNQIDEIPFGRLQRLFLVMEQRARSSRAFEQERMMKESKKARKK